jgi:hypothetical protein
VFQRYTRAWLVRREGWWAHAAEGMVLNRARKRRWLEHRSEVVAAAPGERALLNTVGGLGFTASDEFTAADEFNRP